MEGWNPIGKYGWFLMYLMAYFFERDKMKLSNGLKSLLDVERWTFDVGRSFLFIPSHLLDLWR
jgi:hypothetical protein